MIAQYHTVTASPLREVALAFWQVDRLHANEHETIVPKGTLEIIFNFDNDHGFEATIAGNRISLPRCFISGYHTSSIHMLIPERQHFFGINLQTTAANRILKLNAGDFANKCLDLTLVDRSLYSLWHQLGDTADFQRRISIASAWLADRIPSLTARERILDDFLHGKKDTVGSVEQLADTICYSGRQLSRKLLQLTGMNAGQLLHYKKYLYSLELMHFSDDSLSGIAYQAGFSDQSHFIKTFKAFAGMRPGEYRSAKSTVPGHLFEHVR